jgi:hypothetical protein
MDKQKFCEQYSTLEEAQLNCQCNCEESQLHDTTYYHCNYGNCCGYHCSVCGKFEKVGSE